MLRALRELGGARTVKELALELGQHPNTVREHLDALVDADYVLATSAKPNGRGRPAIKYRANPSRGARERAYIDLANELARIIDGLCDAPEQVALQAGRAWGARLIQADPEAVSEGIRSWMGQHGCVAIGGDDREIVIGRCPIVESARQFPSIVCSLHAGAFMEYASHTGLARDVRLTPDFEGRHCVLELGDPPRLQFTVSDGSAD